MGATNLVPFYNNDTEAYGVVRAYDPQTLDQKWEFKLGDITWGGTLATSTGLIFFGDDSGTFAAADAVTGKMLWSFPANANWHASPMTYQFDGQQYVAIAAGGDILTFGLTE